jgi:hypothetical protein
MIEKLLFDIPSIARDEKAPFAEERYAISRTALSAEIRASRCKSALAVGKTYVLVLPRKRAGTGTLFCGHNILANTT